MHTVKKIQNKAIATCFWYCITLVLVCATPAMATINFVSDTTQTKDEDDVKYRNYYFGIDFGSNKTYKSKRTISSGYSSSYFTYTNKSNFSFSISFLNISNSGVRNDETDLGISYDNKLGKRSSWGVGYTYFAYNAQSTQVSTSLTNNIYSYIKFKRWVRTKITADFSWGEDTDYGVYFGFYHPFEIDSIGRGKKTTFTFTPRININTGTVNFFKSSLKKSEKEKIAKGDIREEFIQTRYTLIGTDLILPISFTRKNFTWELSYKRSTPRNQSKNANIQTPPTSAWVLSFYWNIEKEVKPKPKTPASAPAAPATPSK